VAEGATQSLSIEERAGGTQCSANSFARQKIAKRDRRSIVREFFLSRLPAKKFLFLLAEQQ